MNRMSRPLLIWSLLTAAAAISCSISSIQAAGQNVTKIQARIILESNNFDVEAENKPTANDLTSVASIRPNATTIIEKTNSTTTRLRPKKRSKKQRSDRRLNNIWSMFLPNAEAADNEYEEAEESEGTEAAGGASNFTAPNDAGSNSVSRLGSAAKALGSHDEQLVAKYNSRPPRQDGSMTLGNDLMLASNSMQTSSSPTSENLSASNSSFASNNQPVQLITGSLSAKDTISPSMNDIVSNIMNSMNLNNNNSTNDEMNEREDDYANKQTNAGTNPDGSSNFERWLDKIQFQESTTPPPPSGIAMTMEKNRTGNSSTPSAPDVVKMVEALADLRSRQQLQQKHLQNQPLKFPQTRSKSSAVASYPFLQAPKGSHQFNSQRFAPNPHQQQHIMMEHPRATHNLGHSHQHPFQHQLRQQQSQLIHGIRYPAAQASTISVSTQDGAPYSNTSLSLNSALSTSGQLANTFSFLNQPSAITNEMSQSINLTTPSNSIMTSNSLEETGNIEQSVYQSQDEILRQVTSAINFEQQQTKMSSAENHRKSGESLNVTNSNSLESMQENNENGLAKLFKVGSNINELVDGTSSTTAAPNVNALLLNRLTAATNNGSNNANSMLGMDDIDKSFDLLAEKLRLFAQQQQLGSNNSNNSGSPPWLRKPLQNLTSSDNLAQLAAALATSGSSSTKLDQLKALLANKQNDEKQKQQHERVQTALMLQQMVQQQTNNQNDLDRDKDNQRHLIHQRQQQGNQMANLIRGETGSAGNELGQLGDSMDGNHHHHHQQQQQQKAPEGVSNVGWMPMQRPNQLPASPANIMKTRFKQQQLVNKMPDEQLHMNNLAMMLSQAQDNELLPAAAGHLAPNQRIIGLPIAILKEDELDSPEAVQLEAAAAAAAMEQLAQHGRQQQQQQQLANHQAPPKSQTIKPVGQADPNQLNQIQKILQAYSPQTFQQQQHSVSPPMMNQMASLLHDQQQHQQHHEHSAMNSNEHSASTDNKQRANQQQLDRQQQQNALNNNQPMVQSLNEHPTRPGLVSNEMPQYVTTTVTGEGPPVRLREVSLYKPFGFRTHHAISYQASPTMAAIFPNLNNDRHHHHHHHNPHSMMMQHQPPSLLTRRPSLLKHMSPFRATFNEGQRLLAPMMGGNLIEGLTGRPPHHLPPPPMMSLQFPSQTQTLINSIPLPPPLLSPSHYHRPPFAGPMRRHTLGNNLKEKWHSKFPGSHTAANQHGKSRFDYGGDATVADHLIETTLPENFEEIKFVPLSSSNELLAMDEHEPNSGQLRAKQTPRFGVKPAAPSPALAHRPKSGQRQQRGDHPLLEQVSKPSIITTPCLTTTSTTTTTTPRPAPANSTEPSSSDGGLRFVSASPLSSTSVTPQTATAGTSPESLPSSG